MLGFRAETDIVPAIVLPVENGILVFLFGVGSSDMHPEGCWAMQSSIKGKNMNRFCQSCGMPMQKDPQKGGTNSDGSKNVEYCSFCYQDGAFCSPEIKTAKEMQAFCIGKMKEMGMSGFVAWLFTRGIPKLKRWNP